MSMKVTNKKAVDLIADRIPFTGSHFYGVIPSPDPDQISLGLYEGSAIVDDIKTAEYIVYSYSTPIAWFYGGGWSITSDRFSATTARHRALTHRAIDKASGVTS